MAAAKEAHREDMERFIALQFLFDKQWKAVKARALDGPLHAPRHSMTAHAAGPCTQLQIPDSQCLLPWHRMIGSISNLEALGFACAFVGIAQLIGLQLVFMPRVTCF